MMSLSDESLRERPIGRLRILSAAESGRGVLSAAEGLEALRRPEPHPAPAPAPAGPVSAGELLRTEFLRGLEQGRVEIRETLEAQLRAGLEEERRKLVDILASLSEQVPRLTAQRERLVVRLAVAVAERIVRRELTVDPEVVLRQVQDAVRRVHGVERITLRVHPRDLEIVRAHRQDIAAGSEAIREVTVEPDEHVEPGGCILESESGTVDAQLLTQIRNMETALLDSEDAGEKRA